MKKILLLSIMQLGFFLTPVAYSQDKEVVTLGDTITGNQEQPKVLYIVPWKQPKDNSLLNQSLESRLSDVFAHVERSEHTRELQYFEALMSSASNEEEIKP